MSRGTGNDPYEAAAHRATVLVGDGCVIRRSDEAGGLRAVAADHRDSHRRVHFRALLDAPPLESSGGWIDQALERGHALRLPDLRPRALASVGIPADDRIGDAIVVPVAGAGTAILALRDRAAGRYSERERRQLEEITALLAGCVEGRRGRVAPSPDETFDPVANGLLDATSAALWVVDSRERTRYVNEAASELVGVPAGRLTGIPISEVLGPPVGRPRTGFYGRAACDRALLRTDGSTTWVTVTSRPLFDADGEEGGTLYTLVEVGDRRLREVDLRFRLQQSESLLEIAERAATDGCSEELLADVVAFVVGQLGVELAALAAYDPETECVKPIATSGSARQHVTELDRPLRTYRLAPGWAASAALETGDPVLVGDYESQSLYSRPPEVMELGVRSAAFVPFASGRMILTAHSTRPGALDGESLNLLESLVRLVEPHWARC